MKYLLILPASLAVAAISPLAPLGAVALAYKNIRQSGNLADLGMTIGGVVVAVVASVITYGLISLALVNLPLAATIYGGYSLIAGTAFVFLMD